MSKGVIRGEKTVDMTVGSVGSSATRSDRALSPGERAAAASVCLTERGWLLMCRAQRAASLLIPPYTTSTRKKYYNLSHTLLYGHNTSQSQMVWTKLGVCCSMITHHPQKTINMVICASLFLLKCTCTQII